MLDGVRVLLDGYHLGMARGSGVRTYGLTLLETLFSLNAEVSILYDLPVKRKGEALLSYVDFLSELSHHSYSEFIPIEKRKSSGHFLRATLKKALRKFRSLLYLPKGVARIDTIPFIEIPESCRYLRRISSLYSAALCFDASDFFLKYLGLNYTFYSLRDKFDLFHVTYPKPITIPGTKKVTTVHDLIPLKLPDVTLMDKRYFYKVVKDAIKKSSAIFTVSEASKKDLMEFYDVSPDKVVVTYQPVNTSLLTEFLDFYQNDAIAESRVRAYSLQPKRYILFVGVLEPKKNVRRLLEAYVSLDTDLDLVIVGRKGWLFEDIFNFYHRLRQSVRQKIHFFDYLPRLDLACLYSQAITFVFPSLYEGFGLPPLEAMSFGCPVVASSTSSLPEVCGDAAIYVDPYSVSSIAHGIARVIGDDDLREELRVASQNRSKVFSLEAYQEKIVKAYQKLL